MPSRASGACLVVLLVSILFGTSRSLIDESLVDQALQYLFSTQDDQGKTAVTPELVQAVQRRDARALHHVAKHANATNNQELSLKLLHALADDVEGHVSSQVTLAFHYYGIDVTRSLHYFVLAGERGPHQAALYNAGRIFAEMEDYVPAMAYIRAAATFDADASDSQLQGISKQAFEVLSEQMSRKNDLSIEQVADLFLYGSLEDFPAEGSKAAELWKNAMMAMHSFNQTWVDTAGQAQHQSALQQAFDQLHQLWKAYSGQLSHLQSHFVLDFLNDVLGPLAGLDDSFVHEAATYAHELAASHYCYRYAARREEEAACFNGAAASAVSYYRRGGDGEGTRRTLDLARQHPTAATHWLLADQTPRVFHPTLVGQPWWNASLFAIASSLETLYQQRRDALLTELNAVKQLQEGSLRGSSSSTRSGKQAVAQLASNGDVRAPMADQLEVDVGLQRIFTPYIGVRTDSAETAADGAGGWSEFGPLFDGLNWNHGKCQHVPTICNAVKAHSSLLCESGLNDATEISPYCGSDTVVTILRLRPGTHILPHCGTTNARLILHFCLEGCQGIDFTVGGLTKKDYGGHGNDGYAIAFDDSFEHSVKHNGKQDRYVVLAVLAHPGAADLS